ncbi:hypothetical protein BDZ91DRAFT_556939 [Kalaharituber pfeilii]|nr:hypothetical protein BDZ91DRAFT_556939 [Kalaharituber pfeilii]
MFNIIGRIAYRQSCPIVLSRHVSAVTTIRVKRDFHDDTDTSCDDSINTFKSLNGCAGFVTWKEYSKLSDRVSMYDKDISMTKLQYDFLDLRFDGLNMRFDGLNTRLDRLEKKIEAMGDKFDRKFETIGTEMDRRFEALDRKMTTWFLGLMGLVVIKGGLDFFASGNRNGKYVDPSVTEVAATVEGDN